MRRYLLVLMLSLLTASAAWADAPQHETNIHPPRWAMGVWTNALESDSRRILFLEVAKNSILITRGVPGLQADLLKQYPGWTIKESATDDHYQIEFRNRNRIELFALTLHRPHPGSQTSRVLTLYMDRAPGSTAAEPTPISVGLMLPADLPGLTTEGSHSETRPNRE